MLDTLHIRTGKIFIWRDDRLPLHVSHVHFLNFPHENTYDVTHNTGVTLRCASKRRFQHFSQKPKGLQGDVVI